MEKKILVVEDEKNIQKLISYNLKKEGYAVLLADNGIDGVNMVKSYKPDLVVLDIMLPGKNGFEVCREVKYNADTSSIPIIMLSAKDGEIDKVVGLEIGADDYMTKPFSPKELLARIKANLRQKTTFSHPDNPGDDLVHGRLRIRPKSYEVFIDEKRVEMPPKEFELLYLLASNPGRVFTRTILLEKVWGIINVKETRTLDVHVRYLRQKIEADPANPQFILTVRGIGYRFRDIT